MIALVMVLLCQFDNVGHPLVTGKQEPQDKCYVKMAQLQRRNMFFEMFDIPEIKQCMTQILFHFDLACLPTTM